MSRFISTILAIAIAGCTTRQGYVGRHTSDADDAERNRIANLERAVQYPWTDDGVCAVREASGEWRTLVEKCYHALDLSRIRFQDKSHRCAVANADAATIGRVVVICMMVQPEIAVGAVVVLGALVVAAAIAAELQKCMCMCMGIDELGRTHGPYRIGKVKSKFDCEQRCSQRGYAGGGFCK